MDVALRDGYLVSGQGDLLGEIGVAPADESDRLDDTAERSVGEWVGRCPGCFPRPAPVVKVRFTVYG